MLYYRRARVQDCDGSAILQIHSMWTTTVESPAVRMLPVEK